jgi:hypothetical protein
LRERSDRESVVGEVRVSARRRALIGGDRIPVGTPRQVPRCAPIVRFHHLLTAGLGDDVVVEVIGVRGGTVRLGVDAPRSLPV